MKRHNLQILLTRALFTIIVFSVSASAQITPSQDAFTNGASPGINYGANTLLNVNSASEMSYIQFNLASVPTGATVSQATLKLFVTTVTNPGSFNIEFVTGAWAEGTITYNMAPVIGSAIASSVPIAADETNEYVLVDITPAVYEWVSGSQPNDGIALVANGVFNASFDSKENTTTSHAPELDIVLTGGGGTISGVLTGTGSGLTGGGASGTLNLSLSTACAANQVMQWSGSSWGCANPASGTITGVTAGSDLSGGGIGGAVTVALDTTKVPQLNAVNTYTGNQTVNGNLNATGIVTGGSYQIGSNLFAFGSYTTGNAFLGFAGNPASTGVDNVAIGRGALSFTTSGGDNSAYGAFALQTANSTAGSNSGVGYVADTVSGANNTATGAIAITDGNDGTSFGADVLGASSPFSGNTGVGSQVFGFDNESPENTAIGYQAIYNNQSTGGLNTAVGFNSLFGGGYPGSTGTSNTAVGVNAVWRYTTGSLNTGTGYYAVSAATTGSSNTGTGYSAVFGISGDENTGIGLGALGGPNSGNDLTCIGYDCVAQGKNIVNGTAIGAHAIVTQSNSVVLGGTGLYTAKVGIGTAAPTNILTIARGTGHAVSDSWETYSSRRWKTNIRALPHALDKVARLRGVSYDLKDSGKHEIGLIAEEVGEVVPEVVSYEPNQKDALSVDYSRLTALLIEAVKEQQRAIMRTQMQFKKLASQDALFESSLIHLDSHGSAALRSAALTLP
jgi:hypothetical protein